jgi:hypothetical protein
MDSSTILQPFGQLITGISSAIVVESISVMPTLKGEPTISKYGSQGKSQAQPDGGEGHSIITTGVSDDGASEGSGSAEVE